jgi:hypothetical protein
MNILKSILDLFPIGKLHKNLSVLFILKKRSQNWGQTGYTHNSSGLLNSATFVHNMLIQRGVKSKLVEVVDGNDIDREVFQYNPDVVILEAIWCPPSKVRELSKLWHHKGRKWIVRNHSELPFLAMEGIALEWLLEYATIDNTFISCNSPVAREEVEALVESKYAVKNRVLLLTNYYPIPQNIHFKKKCEILEDNTLDISCFGAIRPLKNHIEQAVAAILYAKSQRLKLRFHINATRIEGKGEPVLKSLRGMFNGNDCILVEHGWMNRDEFVHLCSTMDVGLQVSFSETYNIVAADHVTSGVPVIGSDEIPWLPREYHAIPTAAIDIALKIDHAIKHGAEDAVDGLSEYNEHTERAWLHQLQHLNG